MTKPWTKQYFECACHSSEHTIAFIIDEYDVDNGCDLYTEVQLINWRPWYKRIWPAIKYLFNVEPVCRWDSWLMNEDDITRLQGILAYVKAQKNKSKGQTPTV